MVTCLKLLLCHDAFLDLLFSVLLEDWPVSTDLLVHERLGEERLIHLVVTVASVAHLQQKIRHYKKHSFLWYREGK